MKKQNIWRLIFFVLVILLIIGGISAIKKAKKREAMEKPAASYPITVSAVKAKLEPAVLTLPFLAQVQNDNDVMLSSKLASHILYVKPRGSFVQKGNIVVRLDKTTLEAGLQSIRSQKEALNVAMKNLQKSHERTGELIEVKGASKEQYEMEESKIAEIKSKIEALDHNELDLNNSLTYTNIKAPVSGIISKTMKNVGDISMPGQPIASISAGSGSYLVLSLPADIKIQGAYIGDKLYDAQPLKGTFNGLVQYRINAANINSASGERIDTDVVIYKGDAIVLPFDAVLNRSGENYVFLVGEKKAEPYKVNIIKTGEEGIVIDNKELDGKNIIVEKQDVLLSLLSGAPVKLKNS